MWAYIQSVTRSLLSLYSLLLSLAFRSSHCLLDCCNILLTGFPLLSLPSPICFSCCSWSAFLKIKWKSDALFPQRAQGKNQVTAVQASRWSEKKKGDPQVSSWFSAQLAMEEDIRVWGQKVLSDAVCLFGRNFLYPLLEKWMQEKGYQTRTPQDTIPWAGLILDLCLWYLFPN